MIHCGLWASLMASRRSSSISSLISKSALNLGWSIIALAASMSLVSAASVNWSSAAPLPLPKTVSAPRAVFFMNSS